MYTYTFVCICYVVTCMLHAVYSSVHTYTCMYPLIYLSSSIHTYCYKHTYRQVGRQAGRHTGIQTYTNTWWVFFGGHLLVQQSFVNIVILYSAFWVPVVRMENSPGPADYVLQPGSPADKRGKRVRPQGIFLQSLSNHMCKTGHCCDPTMFFHVSYLQKMAD